MNLEQTAVEDLAKTATWLEDSLRYAREHGQWKVTRLLRAVVDEIELEAALLVLPAGEHLHPEGEGSPRRRRVCA